MIPSPRLLRLLALGLPVAALPALVDPRAWPVIALGWLVLALLAIVDILGLSDAEPSSIQVELPATLGVGDPARAALVLVREEPPARPLGLTVRAETRGAIRGLDDAPLCVSEEQTPLDLPLAAPERGEGSLEAVWLRFEGRFGLVQRIVRHELGAETRVVPSVRAVERLSLAAGVTSTQVGNTVGRGHGAGTEFDELRVYQPGMDTRAIDWKASARHLELRVRRFMPEQNQRIVVSLDLDRAMSERIEGLSRLDHAIHTGLALAQVALRNGDQVGLHAFGVRPQAWLPPRAGRSQLRRLAHEAASLVAEERESNPVRGVRDLLSRLRRRTLVVLLSDLRDPIAAELLTEALGSLARKHVVVLVALADPLTHDPLSDEPADLADIARATVRDELAHERRAALARLRGRGVHVLSAAPGAAAVLLLRRYIHVKKRGRLG